MKRHLILTLAMIAIASAFATEAAAGWIFLPSTYSHDPATGQRVDQYAPKQIAYARVDPTYLQSGYRHKRTTLRGADGTADRLHVVETWGEGDRIRPYGEWQFPYRAGATPYGPWGNAGGPWTLPFDSWQNPYCLGNLRNPPWPYWPTPAPAPAPLPGGPVVPAPAP